MSDAVPATPPTPPTAANAASAQPGAITRSADKHITLQRGSMALVGGIVLVLVLVLVVFVCALALIVWNRRRALASFKRGARSKAPTTIDAWRESALRMNPPREPDANDETVDLDPPDDGPNRGPKDRS